MNKVTRRLRFYYLLLFDGQFETGVNKKIFSQIQYLNNLGINVKLILIGHSSNVADSPYIIRERMITGKGDSIFSRIFRSRKIARIIRDRIRELGPSDILYIRYPLIINFCPINFFKPFRKCKVIFEYNSLIQSEYFLTHRYLYLFIEFFFGYIVLYQANGGIGVTHEITDFQKKKLGCGNQPFITIPNGITVSSNRRRSPPVYVPEQKITMICVANFSQWHGVDRLIRGLARYSGKNLIELNLVGGGPEIPNLKRLCTQNNISDCVIFHGFLSGPELDRLFDTCHIAIGSLGIHRKGLSQTSELKAREYCSRGIPFVIACGDADFPEDFPWILRIAADESPVDIEKIITFVSHIYQDIDHPQKMRQYAIEHLDWSIKMKKLKIFLEESIINR